MDFFKFALICFFTFTVSVPLFAQKKEKGIELIIPEKREEIDKWGNDADLSNLSVIQGISEESSKKKLETASKSFLKAVQYFQKKEMELEESKNQQLNAPNTELRYEWQKQARDESIIKEYERQKLKARERAISILIDGMNALEKIENPKVIDTQTYREIKSGLYREYAKHKYSSKDFLVAQDILERYIEIEDKNNKESEPHKLLAYCYERLSENMLKNRKTSGYLHFKELKKKHLLEYAELQYGMGSEEYKLILEKIERE